MKLYNPMNIKEKDIFITSQLLVDKPSVFLAGPCPRGDEGDWREEFLEKAKDLDINFFSPSNPEYGSMGPNAYEIQCNWERTALESCHIILFWVARDDKHPALTTNVEFGYWLQRRPTAIIYGRPDDAKSTKYLDWLYVTHTKEEFGKKSKIYNSLDEIIKKLDKWAKKF